MKDYNDFSKTSDETKYPLTIGQKGLWFLHQLDPLSDRYHMPLTFKFSDEVSIKDLQNVLTAFVDRQSILKSTFHEIDGKTYRKINLGHDIQISEHDIGSLKHSELLHKVRHLSEVPFNLEQGPLIRADILNGYQGGKILLLTIHHLIFDGASLKILCDEFELIYQSLFQGKQLSAMKYDYNDFQIWQQQWLQSDDAQSSRDYWLDKLSGELPQLNLPTDNISSKSKSIRGEVLKFSIPQTIIKRFKQFAKDYKCSEYLIWLTAYFAFLSRYTSQTDIIVGTPAMGRPEVEFDDIVGYFVNLIPLRCQLSSSDSFIDVLTLFKSEIYESLMHADYPLAEIINALGDSSQRGDQPLFQTNFAWTVTEQLKLNPNSLLGLEIHPLIHESGEQNLSLELLKSSEDIKALLKYRSNYYSAESITRIKDSFLNFIDGISFEPDSEIQQISLVTEADEKYQLHTLNDTRVDYPNKLCIHQLFEQQVNKTPDNIAVVSAEQSLSYTELNTKANQLAHYLIEQGVKADSLVGLCFERSLEMMVGLLAILKSGAAYLPLDPNYPKARLEHMMTDSGLFLLLTQKDLITITSGQGRGQLLLDDQEFIANLDSYATSNPTVDDLTSDHLAYVIYTSGSTGLPKGVMNTHKSLNNLCQWHIKEYTVTADKRASHLASIGFDAAVWEIWPYLICGASIQLISDEIRVSPHALIKTLKQNNITHCFLPTALLEASFELFDTDEKTKLAYILTGGEKLTNHGFINSSTRLVNHYGPTESTVVTTSYETKADESNIPPIGKPIANTHLYVLDNNQQLLPIGSIGELYIGGAGVARGYLNNQQLTSERFIQNPFDSEDTERLYRTGDFVKYLEDGNLEFIGRVDQQVKIRGFRIELGEIEQQLSEHPDVLKAFVIIQEDSKKEKRLIAYFNTNSSEKESDLINGVRSALQRHLPDYMVPSAFIVLEQFPVTANGKVDLKSLPNPNVLQFSREYLPPDGEIELMLVAIWSELLNIPQVQISANANFFELGGHSLLVTKLINDINKKIHIEIKYIDVFNYSILRNLSTEIDNKLKTNSLIESLAESNNDSIEELEW